MQDKLTLISVIITLRNKGVVLSETINCLVQQTFRKFECILIDDGATNWVMPESLIVEVLKPYQVKVIHYQNPDSPAARNTGIQKSSGRYLFFLNSDDLIDPTFIEKAYLFLEQNQQFAFVNSYVIGFGAQDYKWSGGFHEKEIFLKENRNTSCFMARRKVFDFILFDETMRQGCEDWDFWLNAAANGFWGYTIPEYLFFYRRSAENKWATLTGKEMLGQIENTLRQKYEHALVNNFPSPQLTDYTFGFSELLIEKERPPVKNHTQQLLCIFPWLELGGADQFNINLLKGLKTKGWSITIVTTVKSKHQWEDKFKEITTDVFHLANLSKEILFPALLTYLIERRQPKLVFLSNSMYGYYILPLLKQRFPDLPVTDYLHCEDVGWYNGGYPYFSTLYNGLLDKTFTTSCQLRNWCIEKGALPEKISTVYINVDTNKIIPDKKKRAAIRTELGIKEGTPVLLYVARLTEQKQPKVLAHTLIELQKKAVPFHCTIIGDGPDKEQLLPLLQQHSLVNKVSYLGSQPNNVVLDYMDAADVFFLPSLYEGIALSIYEAMAKGLAIVSANVGGQAELVTQNCGVLIEQINAEADVKNYVAVFSRLLANPDQLKQLGEQSRARVVHSFGIDHMIDQMNEAFQKIKITALPNSKNFQSGYLLLLNRMLYLEEENRRLSELSNTRLVRVASKFKKPYQRLKDVYAKYKRVVKNK